MAKANQSFSETKIFKNIRNSFFILILYPTYNLQNLEIEIKLCHIDVKSDLFRKNSPIFVSLNEPGPDPKYIYPTKKVPDRISIPAGQIFKVFCPGQTNQERTKIDEPGLLRISNKILIPRRSIENVECVENYEFKIHNYHDKNNIVSLKEISCKFTSRSYAYNAIIKKKSKKCGIGKSQGNRYEIGYDLGNYGFLKTIDLCHVEKESKTFWAHSVLVPVNQEEYREKHKKEKKKPMIGRFNFLVGPLYKGLGLTSAKNRPYKKENQFEIISDLLKDNKKAEKYISSSKNGRRFLAGGHLIARADQFYRSGQDSTYFFANAVPMWQQINAAPGNWFFVEQYLRHLAFHKNTELDVWAGGIGILDLEDKSNKKCKTEPEQMLEAPKLLILSNKVIPVPKVLFKCAVEKARTEGLCFLVVNNPYLSKSQVEESENKYIVCKKYLPCKKVKSDYDKMELGYFYCCMLSDFIEKFEEELSLQDLKEFKEYPAMSLLTYEKNPKIVKVLRSDV